MNTAATAPRRRQLALLFVAALALRLLAIALLAPQHAAQGSTVWDFGHEAACLGHSLLTGQGLADPWGHGTGPSAWLTPPYPALLALLMWLFDGVNPSMALALFTLQSLASAATCILVVRLGENLNAPRAGWWGGVLFALYPPAIWNAVAVVWDTTFVALGTVACLVALTRPGAFANARRVAALGLAWGALALLNPAPLALLPAVLAYLWLSGLSVGERVRNALLLGVCMSAVCAPWMLRNWRVLGTPALRPNFGVELRLGNNPDSNGHPVPMKFHPSHVPEELSLYRELGERDYATNSRQRALDWIRAQPAQFGLLSLRRVLYFWLGDPPFLDQRTSAGQHAALDPNAWAKALSFAALGFFGWVGALRWRGPLRERALLIGALTCFGIAYYVTHVSERYRFPLDPLLALLCATSVLALLEHRRSKLSSQ